MKMIIEGVFSAKLPWILVILGIVFAVVLEILQIPILPVAIGLYLPIHLSTPIMVGGLIRGILEQSNPQETRGTEREDRSWCTLQFWTNCRRSRSWD